MQYSPSSINSNADSCSSGAPSGHNWQLYLHTADVPSTTAAAAVDDDDDDGSGGAGGGGGGAGSSQLPWQLQCCGRVEATAGSAKVTSNAGMPWDECSNCEEVQLQAQLHPFTLTDFCQELWLPALCRVVHLVNSGEAALVCSSLAASLSLNISFDISSSSMQVRSVCLRRCWLQLSSGTSPVCDVCSSLSLL